MKQEDKELLLKDLCARLPYNVLVECSISEDASMDIILQTTHINELKNNTLIIKPYLRPMSSMTEEEKKELKEEHKKDEKVYAEVLERISNGDESARGTAVPHFAADWCNKNHFDYRGLIPMGLALEAPEGMYEVQD